MENYFKASTETANKRVTTKYEPSAWTMRITKYRAWKSLARVILLFI